MLALALPRLLLDLLLLFCLSTPDIFEFVLVLAVFVASFIVTIALNGCFRKCICRGLTLQVLPDSLRGSVCESLDWGGKQKTILYSIAAPVAVGQLRDSRGRKSPTIHPLQSLSAPLPGAETGSCKCSLFWQTHPLHLHGTPYKTPWNKVTIFDFLFLF